MIAGTVYLNILQTGGITMIEEVYPIFEITAHSQQKFVTHLLYKFLFGNRSSSDLCLNYIK